MYSGDWYCSGYGSYDELVVYIYIKKFEYNYVEEGVDEVGWNGMRICK